MIKKKLISWIIGVSSVAVGTAAVISGYFSSINKNPYASYFRRPVYNTNTSLVRTYEAAAINGAEIIIGAGFTHTTPIAESLNNRKVFDKKGYVLIDDEYYNNYSPDSFVYTDQVASIKFRADEGSFLTGIAVGQYLNDHKDFFAPNSGDILTYAAYVGQNNSGVTPFASGLQHGINYFNNIIVKKDKSLKPIYQVVGPSSIAGNFGPSDGDSILENWLRGNANVYTPFEYNNPESYQLYTEAKGENKIPDIIMPIAGSQSLSGIRMIKTYKNKTVLIGVDSPLELNKSVNGVLNDYIDGNYANKIDIVPFSSLKKIDVLLDKVLNKINQNQNDGTNDPEGLGGFGWTSYGTLNNDGVGLSESGHKYLIKALKLINPKINTYDDARNFLKEQPEFKTINNVSKIQINGGKLTNEYNVDPQQAYLNNNGTFFVAGKQVLTYEPLNSSGFTTKNDKIPQLKDKEEFFNSFKNFADKDKWNKNKIVIIGSSNSVVLFDKSFSESTYIGLYYFYKSKGINIPTPPTLKK